LLVSVVQISRGAAKALIAHTESTFLEGITPQIRQSEAELAAAHRRASACQFLLRKGSPSRVGWVERSEPHLFSGEFLWWGSLRSTHPTDSYLPQQKLVRTASNAPPWRGKGSAETNILRSDDPMILGNCVTLLDMGDCQQPAWLYH
jgi:hypothetical protein